FRITCNRLSKPLGLKYFLLRMPKRTIYTATPSFLIASASAPSSESTTCTSCPASRTSCTVIKKILLAPYISEELWSINIFWGILLYYNNGGAAPSASFLTLTTLAGLPATTLYGGTSLVTTLPAATTEPLPTV